MERVNDYHEGNRHFQDRFDTRRIADQIASRTRDHINDCWGVPHSICPPGLLHSRPPPSFTHLPLRELFTDRR
jgi:hypothetical protein